MKVHLKTVAGRSFEVEISSTAKVSELKKAISKQEDYDLSSIKIAFNGSALNDDINVSETGLTNSFGVVVAKKNTVKAAQEAYKAKENNKKEEVDPVLPQDSPSGPLTPHQIAGLLQLQGLMQSRVRNLHDFAQLLRLHGTVTELRTLIQQDPSQLAPILYQINYHTPQLLAAINVYQTEFLAIINEPVRTLTARSQSVDYDWENGSQEGNSAVVYITPEEDEAIQRLAALGFPHQVAAEAFIMCNRREDMAAAYLFDSLEQGAYELEAQANAPSRTQISTNTAPAPPPPAPQLDTTQAPFAKLVKALIGQRKIEEALAACEQWRVEPDPKTNRNTDSLSRKLLTQYTRHSSTASSHIDHPPAMELTDIRRISTEANATVVYYANIMEHHEWFVWVISSKPSQPIEFVSYPSKDELLKDALQILNQKHSVTKQALISKLKALNDALILPIKNHLPKSPEELVCIIPAEGDMSLLPFEIFMDTDDSMFIQKHTLMYCQSFHMMATCLQMARRDTMPGRAININAPSPPLSKSVMETLSPSELTSPILATTNILNIYNSSAFSQCPEFSDPKSNMEWRLDLVTMNTNSSSIWTTARNLIAVGASSVVLPLFDTQRDETTLNHFYEFITTQKLGKANALRKVALESIKIDVKDWCGWRIIGHPGTLTTSLLPTTKPQPTPIIVSQSVPPNVRSQSPTKDAQPNKSSKKKKSKSRHAEDYKYLKDHRVHVLYECMVRELLKAKPEDVSTFILNYMQSNQSNLISMLNDPKARP